MTALRDIAGHGSSIDALRRAIASGRLHHALLFHGPDGVGKRTTALAVAAALLCREASRPEGDACGTCASCSKVGKGIHPDVQSLTLEKTVIPIDAVRALRQEAGYRPFEGTHRVFLIDPADRLSHEAQNALLKTLEEPSASARLILITSRPAHLLPTTRSRCQALAFGTLPPAELARLLERQAGMAPERAMRAARLAQGRYGAARDMDLERADELRDALIAVLDVVATPGPRADVLDQADALGEEPDEIAERLDVLGSLVRDMMVMAAGGTEDLLVSGDRAGDLSRLAARFPADPHVFVRMMDRVGMARVDLDRSLNRRLLAETLLLDLAEATDVRPA